MKKPAAKKPAATKPAARKKSVKPAAKSTPRAKAGSGAKPAASRSAKPPAPGAVVADPHAGHDMTAMPGMTTPGANPNPGAGHDMSAMPDTSGGAAPGQPGAMQGMDHGSGAMQGMAGHDMGSMPPSATGTTMVGTNLPAGNAPPPPIPMDRAADQVYSAPAMAHSQQHLQSMHGGQNFSQVIFNLAEYQVRDGRDAYRWDGGAWYGGDINRLVLKTEGEGNFGRSLERAELQALYARAIGPFTDFQAGIRYDFKPNPSRVYATVGFETLAPGFFDVEGALFLSSKGDVLGRLEGYYDAAALRGEARVCPLCGCFVRAQNGPFCSFCTRGWRGCVIDQPGSRREDMVLKTVRSLPETPVISHIELLGVGNCKPNGR